MPSELLQGDLFARRESGGPSAQWSSSADIEGPYRYSLARRWASGETVCWVMLNPSKADADRTDPTLTRCIIFSRDWGFGGLEVVNLFALISTNPKGLRKSVQPVGPRNDEAILAAAARAARVVCAWGPGGALGCRDEKVIRLLEPFDPHALRFTKDGHPGHPLYLPSALKPVPWVRSTSSGKGQHGTS